MSIETSTVEAPPTSTVGSLGGSARIVGWQPMLPWPLSRSSWWTEPVRAERLAVLRIGVGLVLLLDVLFSYLVCAGDFFGKGSLSDNVRSPTASVAPLARHRALLVRVTSPVLWQALLCLWALAGLLLVLGVVPRLAAAVAWFFSISVMHVNPDLHNNGDQIRNTLLFLLMFCPSGAAWSVSAWWRRRPDRGPTLIYPWLLRLLLIQLATMYFMNGLYKVRGSHWHRGWALSYVLGDVSWTRWSFAGWPLPFWLLVVMAWTVVLWELGFPMFLFLPRLRVPALLFGVAFHLGTGLTMRLAPFPLYALCLYLPLVPWECWIDKWKGKNPLLVSQVVPTPGKPHGGFKGV